MVDAQAAEKAAVVSYEVWMAAKTKKAIVLSKMSEDNLTQIDDWGVEVQYMRNDPEDAAVGLEEDDEFLAEAGEGIGSFEDNTNDDSTDDDGAYGIQRLVGFIDSPFCSDNELILRELASNASVCDKIRYEFTIVQVRQVWGPSGICGTNILDKNGIPPDQQR